MRFTRKQLLFIVKLQLENVLATSWDNSPSCMSYEDRLEITKEEGGTRVQCLTASETYSLEAAGHFLSALAARLTGNGMGTYDALKGANHFDNKFKGFVRKIWAKQGKPVKDNQPKDGFTFEDYYKQYDLPDATECAEHFVEWAFGDYLEPQLIFAKDGYIAIDSDGRADWAEMGQEINLDPDCPWVHINGDTFRFLPGEGKHEPFVKFFECDYHLFTESSLESAGFEAP